MLYDTLLRMIERGQAEGLLERIDVLYALDRLTETEYKDLTAKLEER